MYTVDTGSDFFIRKREPNNHWGKRIVESKQRESCFYEYVAGRKVVFGEYDKSVKTSSFAMELSEISPEDYE